MIYTKPENFSESLPYSIVKVQGCAEVNMAFDLLNDSPGISRRRYCNKVLVHECVPVPAASPLDLTGAEFIATSDSCYRVFELYKSTEDLPDYPASIEFELDDDDLVISVLVKFDGTETCCVPLRLAYRLYGIVAITEERKLLSNGVLYVTPCVCTDGEGDPLWTDIVW